MRVNRRIALTSIAGLTAAGAAGLGMARADSTTDTGAGAGTGAGAAVPPTQPPAAGPPYTALAFDGLCENPNVPGDTVAVPPGSRTRFVENSSVLLANTNISTGIDEYCVPLGAPAGQISLLPSVQAAREWLAAGRIPASGTEYADMAVRVLLDLRLALRPNGALPAGPTGLWELVWPRDSSWAAAAFSAAGHHAEALRIVRFLAQVQLRDGTWAARTLIDGSGKVPDGRPPQLDAVGWVPWAAWCWYTAAPAGQARTSSLRALWPAITAAANVAAASLQSNGLPPVAGDYWEVRPGVTIGNAAALSCGLRAAASLGRTLGDPRASTWAAAEVRLAAATTAAFGPTGYRRTPAANSPIDAAVAWLGPPLIRPTAVTAAVTRAISNAIVSLRVSNGGLTAGLPGPGAVGNAWTPETAFFALHEAASGQGTGTGTGTGTADSQGRQAPQSTQDPQSPQGRQAAQTSGNWLDWLGRHRTPLGSFAEQVTPIGGPGSMAPLAWTNAIVLLTLSALDRPLPIP